VSVPTERIAVAESTPSVHAVLAIEPVIRRVVASRVGDPSDVDDLVHDCLERLLRARNRLAPDTVLPFGIVTAQNLVTSQARSAARRSRRAHRLSDRIEPDRPDDIVVATEARSAMTVALARLSPRERHDLLVYQDQGTRSAGSDIQESPGALRVRMARTRAKLRLEYLLALRRETLPSPACRRVLLSISGGDTRRQRALAAGEHLLDCRTCAELAEPLEKRSLALTAVVFPIALAAWAAGKARAHPVMTSGAVAAGVAAVVAGTVLLAPAASPTTPTHHHRPSALRAASTTPPVSRAVLTAPTRSRPSSSSSTSTTSTRTTSTPTTTSRPAAGPRSTVTGLKVNGATIIANSSLRGSVGRQVDATGVRVEEVVTLNGFWVGTSRRARVWVELVGPRATLHIVKGDVLHFVGTLEGDSGSYPAHAGVTAGTGARLLATEGAHVAVSTAALRITHS
jgi:RNA polymerase sigma factor (sigma-70 family)